MINAVDEHTDAQTNDEYARLSKNTPNKTAFVITATTRDIKTKDGETQKEREKKLSKYVLI